ncbi:hypothetical protein KM043_003107 [Ampulex compressa]|nr:hypothetical protein KM043_003107 [Ampulex compressa]
MIFLRGSSLPRGACARGARRRERCGGWRARNGKRRPGALAVYGYYAVGGPKRSSVAAILGLARRITLGHARRMMLGLARRISPRARGLALALALFHAKRCRARGDALLAGAAKAIPARAIWPTRVRPPRSRGESPSPPACGPALDRGITTAAPPPNPHNRKEGDQRRMGLARLTNVIPRYIPGVERQVAGLGPKLGKSVTRGASGPGAVVLAGSDVRDDRTDGRTCEKPLCRAHRPEAAASSLSREAEFPRTVCRR